MKKLLIALLISIFFVSGCSVLKVSDKSISDIFDTILFVDNKLSNTNMEGYSFYLPQGLKIIDKKDFNLVIEDKDLRYYLYIDTIAYHYKVDNKFIENSDHFYSKKFEYNGKVGYVDITTNDNDYFVVIMYNYAKIEAFIKKNEFNSALINMSSILSTIKYNDKVISSYVKDKKTVFQEEHFNIFETESPSDNFLKYEEEYGTYKETIVVNKDRDIIDVNETIE